MTYVARHPEAGFTLIEALVAMVILALGAVSLLSAAESHTGRITDATERVAARWIAENALVSTRLGLSEDASNARTYGFDFTLIRTFTDTQDPDLAAVQMKVMRDSTSQQVYVLDGYVAREVLQ